MKTNKEIKEWILANCVDESGNINLNDLDFSDFEGNIFMLRLKAKESIVLNEFEIGGDMYQNEHTVDGDLYQDNQTVGGDLYQQKQSVDGILCQYGQNVGKELFQYGLNVKGGIVND